MGGYVMRRERSVSLCMIVKDEEKDLGRCLESVKDIVDEIIIVDTGSTDKTIEIAKQFNAKIDYFKWQQNFADARNKSLSLATKEWVMVLDADEYLRQEDKTKLIEALNDFAHPGYMVKTLNMTGDNRQDYVTSLVKRIFKNKMFVYQGAIHEQLVKVKKDQNGDQFQITEVGFYHTGYLPSVVKEKNKSERNLSILERLLEQEPDNLFNTFNLAMEYSRNLDFENALPLYDKVYRAKIFELRFMPKLVISRLFSLMNLNKTKEALIAIKEGLEIYPDYTELVYYRGLIEREQKDFKRAIQSFETCLKMGKPRLEIEFQKMCYDLGPLLNIAEIYQEQGQYLEAIKKYSQCISMDSSNQQIVYSIIKCLQSLEKTKRSTYLKGTELSKLITSFIQMGYYEEAKKVILMFPKLKHDSQFIYLYAKAEFYLGNFKVAKKLFSYYSEKQGFKEVEVYLFIINLIEPYESSFEWDFDYLNLKAYLEGDNITGILQNEEMNHKITILIHELAKMCETTDYKRLNHVNETNKLKIILKKLKTLEN